MKIFTLPDVGEGLTEADLVNWLVNVGDTVTVNQVVAEIATAKSLVEIPSPWAGTVKELYVQVGDTVNVGDNFFAIQITSGATDNDDDDAPAQAPLVGSGPKEDTPGRRRRRRKPAPATAAEVETPVENDPEVTEAPEELEPEPTPEPVQKSDLFAKVLAKPPVRKLAKDHGLDLTTITPTGQHGEVTRDDVRAVLDGCRPERFHAAGPARQGNLRDHPSSPGSAKPRPKPSPSPTRPPRTSPPTGRSMPPEPWSTSSDSRSIHGLPM